MIFDHLSNISLYKNLSPDIYAGLEFLHQLSPDIAPGTYQLTPRVKAIVSEYETKVKNEVGFEAHRKNTSRRSHAAVVCRWAEDGEESCGESGG